MARSGILYLAWLVVGFVGSFAIMYGFTPAGPVIALVVWLAYRYLPRIGGKRMPEATGALGGFGAFWLFVGSQADPALPALVGFGAAAVAASLVWYVGAGRRRCRGGVQPG